MIFSCLNHFPNSTVWIFRFQTFSVFLAIFYVLHCYNVHFSFSNFYNVSCHIPGTAEFASHFPHFSVFPPYSRSYCVHFSFSMFFSVSRYILHPAVCVSHFPLFSFSRHTTLPIACITHFLRFLVFLAILQVKLCLCFIFHVFQFSL